MEIGYILKHCLICKIIRIQLISFQNANEKIIEKIIMGVIFVENTLGC